LVQTEDLEDYHTTKWYSPTFFIVKKYKRHSKPAISEEEAKMCDDLRKEEQHQLLN
jgi:hypothetical protein